MDTKEDNKNATTVELPQQTMLDDVVCAHCHSRRVTAESVSGNEVRVTCECGRGGGRIWYAAGTEHVVSGQLKRRTTEWECDECGEQDFALGSKKKLYQKQKQYERDAECRNCGAKGGIRIDERMMTSVGKYLMGAVTTPGGGGDD